MSDKPIHVGSDQVQVTLVIPQDHLDGLCSLINFCDGFSSAGKGQPPGAFELTMHYRSLRSAVQQAKADRSEKKRP